MDDVQTLSQTSRRVRTLPRGRLRALIGPAILVTVGYMDPGNWATDLEGGARFGYQLIWVLVLSNTMAVMLQGLSSRLGIVTGEDLASACRSHYSRSLSITLWILAELGIIACDVAEIVGSAIALQMLFGIPLIPGALLTVLDVFVVLALKRSGRSTLEAIVLTLLLTIALCFAVELMLARPSPRAILAGLRPKLSGASLPVAIGILGATVMPHNLYLHSALVRTEGIDRTPLEKRELLKRSLWGTALALNLALLVNGAILMVSAATFGSRGVVVTDLAEAHALIAPLLGTYWAAVLFAVALLCSGQSATITGTLAGQIVMEGFVRVRLAPAARRLLTRGLAIVPAVGVLILAGESGTMPLLLGSQMVLSFQLPFAVVPLLRFTNSQRVMGAFVSTRWIKLGGGACAALVIVANTALLLRTAHGVLRENAPLGIAIVALVLASLGLLIHLSVVPLATDAQSASRPQGRGRTRWLAAGRREIMDRAAGE